MDWSKKTIRIIFFMLIVTLIPCSIYFGRAEPKNEKEIYFHWAFGALVGPKNDRKLVDIKRDTPLKTGDRIKMLIELRKACFVYLIYKSPRDEVNMLFPYDVKQFEADYKTPKKCYIPQGDIWFELTGDTGLETFYLLASAYRLNELETLIKKHTLAKGSETKVFGNQIISKIREIKKRYRTFKAVAERPVSLMGNVRAIEKHTPKNFSAIDPLAIEILAEKFYSKTFTIDHQ